MRKTLLFIFALTTFGAVAGAQRLAVARPGRAATAVSGPSPTRPTRSIGSAARRSTTATTVARPTCSKQVVDKYPKSDKAGEALYWRAWSLNGSAPIVGTRRISTTPWTRSTASDRNTPRAPSATDAVSLRPDSFGPGQSGRRSSRRGCHDRRKGIEPAAGLQRLEADEEIRMAALDGLMNMNARMPFRSSRTC